MIKEGSQLFQKLNKLYKSIMSDHCILIVSLHRFPNFSEMNNSNRDPWVVAPVIKHVPYVRSLDVSYIEFSKYVKSVYENEEILMIPVKFRWLLKFMAHGSNHNQNYQLIVRDGDGLKRKLIRARRGGTL
jgi:hypothetical protein